MRNSVLGEHQIMNMVFKADPMERIHFHQSIEILYVLEGNPQITIQDNLYQAHPDDIVVINANKRHSYQAKGDVILASFEINYRMLWEMLDSSHIFFWCNSVVNKSAAYDDMRRIMKQILSIYFDQNGQAEVVRQSLYYQLLEVLTANFSVQSGDKRFAGEQDQNEERISEIVNYIHSHYRQKISLNELSEHLYLSVSYLSKYIKKQLGMNFLDYLNNIRLFHAVDDLLYTNQPITAIALNNGFSNVAAFTDLFKKVYNTTPSDYRQEMLSRDQQKEKNAIEEADRRLEKKVASFLEEAQLTKPEDSGHKEESAIVNTNIRTEYDPYWKKMINVGRAADLLRSDMQEQVLLLHEELGFSHVRLWGVFAAEMMLNESSQDGSYHFGTLDQILDFLVKHGIRPYLELGFKPRALHSSLQKALVMVRPEIPFRGPDHYARFLGAFANHLVNRYGPEEIETWYFELWSGEDFDTNAMDPNFYEIFGILFDTMKRLSPRISVGGGGIGIQYGTSNLKKLVQGWGLTKTLPDFFTLYCYPYIQGNEGGTAYIRPSADRDFLKNQLEMAQSVLAESALKGARIHVSEWSSSISNRNLLNDSCFKGAYVIRNVLDCIGKTDVLGYWIGSDIFAENKDNRQPLFGGCGLLSVSGIKKPDFYAYRFLNLLDKYFLYKDEHGIVTTSGNNNYSIVCHNYRHLNYKYYLKKEDELELSRLTQLYEDNLACQVNYQLAGVKNGRYKIKTDSISSDSGSVQEELARIGESSSLSRQEFDYVKQICVPRISIRQIEVKNHLLNFETRMRPQEIQYIHISYLYE